MFSEIYTKERDGTNMKLQVFNHEIFGKVRALEIKGEPWFVGKDIAESLGYERADNAIRTHVDEEDKLTHRISALGQSRNMKIINESGLYSLILRSQLPSSKQFKRWVTSEVLPQIRKTGGYNIRESYTIQDPIERALAWAEEERVRQQQQQLIEQQKPFVDGYKRFLDVADNMDFSTLSKEIGIGRNKLMAQLRDWGVLMTDEYTVMGVKKTGDTHNQPYQKYMDKKFFVVKHKQLKTGQYKPVTLVTPRGATAISKELAKRGLI